MLKIFASLVHLILGIYWSFSLPVSIILEVLDLKYLKENYISDIKFEILKNLDNVSIQKFDCLCIVQHNTKIKARLQ